MIFEKEIKCFLKTTFADEITKQIPFDFDGSASIPALHLRLDLTKILRKQSEIGHFILGNYLNFLRLSEETVCEVLKQNERSGPEYGVSITYHFQNCPLPRHNVQSSEFLIASFQHEGGVVVYFKDAHILSVGQPDLYLFSWEQVWVGTCECEDSKMKMKKNQSLIELVKHKNPNLKEALISEIPRCKTCDSKMKKIGLQNEVYLNCQKIRIVAQIKEEFSKEDIFNTGVLDIYVDQTHLGKLEKDDIMDMCCYLSAEPKVIKTIGKELVLRTQFGLYLICWYKSSTQSSANCAFLSSMAKLSLEYQRCDTPRDVETILQNYKSLVRVLNQVKFPYLLQDTLTTLKLIALSSVFNLIHHEKIHLMVITDEVGVIEKSLTLNGVKIKRWPTYYDRSTIQLLLSSCQNCILMVSNPNKKDFELINSILNEKVLKNMNVALWIIAEPNKELKSMEVDHINVILDLSMEKNINICENVYQEMVDIKLNSFMRKDQDEEVDRFAFTIPKTKEQRNKTYDSLDAANIFGYQQPCTLDEKKNENQIAKDLLNRYFLRSREYKTTSFKSLENTWKIAQGLSYFRNHIQEKGKMMNEKPLINILDALMAIFIEEETGRNKFSSSNTLFANQVSKLMLNEGNCELSFWDFSVDDNNEVEECKRYITKEQMFKRMVGKLMTLLFERQIS